jgi:hypothetical protein
MAEHIATDAAWRLKLRYSERCRCSLQESRHPGNGVSAFGRRAAAPDMCFKTYRKI